MKRMLKHIDIKFQGCKDVFSLFFRHCQRKHIPEIGEVSNRKQSNQLKLFHNTSMELFNFDVTLYIQTLGDKEMPLKHIVKGKNTLFGTAQRDISNFTAISENIEQQF